MGHSEDDAVHKITHKMKTHGQNQVKFSVMSLIYNPLQN